MQYFKGMKNCYNAVDGTFYDAINITSSPKNMVTKTP